MRNINVAKKWTSVGKTYTYTRYTKLQEIHVLIISVHAFYTKINKMQKLLLVSTSSLLYYHINLISTTNHCGTVAQYAPCLSRASNFSFCFISHIIKPSQLKFIKNISKHYDFQLKILHTSMFTNSTFM